MASVESIGQSKNAGESSHEFPRLHVEFFESFVLGLRVRLPVISGNIGYDLNFSVIEAEQFRISDYVVRMFMMSIMTV